MELNLLSAVRPSRLFAATLLVPAVVVPTALYAWMRLDNSFLEMSVGKGPFSEAGAWIGVGVAAVVLYAAPASVSLLLTRRKEPGRRNVVILLALVLYLIALGVWLEARRA